VGTSLDVARRRGFQEGGTARWVDDGLQFVNGSTASLPLPDCRPAPGELWVRTRWRLRTGEGDTLWIGSHAHPLARSRVPHRPEVVDSFPCMDTLRMVARFQPGRYAILEAMDWFIGTPIRETRTPGPALSVPAPVPEAGRFLVWVVAEDERGNRSLPLWTEVSLPRREVVRWRNGRWEYWVPVRGLRVWVMDPTGRTRWSWVSPDSGWLPLPRERTAGIRLLFWKASKGVGEGRWVQP